MTGTGLDVVQGEALLASDDPQPLPDLRADAAFRNADLLFRLPPCPSSP